MSKLAVDYSKLKTKGKKSVIMHRFAENLCYEMFLNSYRFAKRYDYENYPLRQSERGMYAALAASVDRVTPVHLSEIPTSRIKDVKKAEEVSGRIDHWAYYAKTDFLIELKRCSCALTYNSKNSLPKKVEQPWRQLAMQLKSVTKEVENWYDIAVSLGLLVIFPYTAKKLQSTWTRNMSINYVDELVNKLDDLSFYSTWYLPQDMQLHTWGENETEFTPFILIAGSLIVHQTND